MPSNHQQQQQQFAASGGDQGGGNNMQIVITEPMIDGEHREVGSRLVREEDSIGSDITITHTPSIKELANHMSEMKDAYRAKYARGILLFTNVISLIFACLMIYFGSTHNGRTKFSTANEAFSTMGQELANLGKYTANEAEHYFEGMFDPTEGYVKNVSLIVNRIEHTFSLSPQHFELTARFLFYFSIYRFFALTSWCLRLACRC
jgi:hypothetical protein